MTKVEAHLQDVLASGERLNAALSRAKCKESCFLNGDEQSRCRLCRDEIIKGVAAYNIACSHLRETLGQDAKQNSFTDARSKLYHARSVHTWCENFGSR